MRERPLEVQQRRPAAPLRGVIAFAIAASCHSAAFGQDGSSGLTVSGGLDSRASHDFGNHQSSNGMLNAFLNFRKVMSEEGADRYIFVLQTDSSDNFKRPRFYQTYAQVKGPLGRWNVRAGRYIVPFGFLPSYDTERLVLKSMEAPFLGVKLDEGVQLNGFTRAYDYAFSLSGGAERQNPTLVGRIGRESDEVNEGISILAGRLPEFATEESLELSGNRPKDSRTVSKFRIGYDRTQNDGPNLWRAQVVTGTDELRAVVGAYAEYERALNPKWSLNFQSGAWLARENRFRAGIGATYNAGDGRFVRLAFVHQRDREEKNAITIQFYWEFSRQH